MNTNILLAVITLLVLVIGANHFFRPEIIQTQSNHNQQGEITIIEAKSLRQVTPQKNLPPSVSVQLTNSIQEEDQPIKLNSQAISSLEFARLNGDNRSPPIQHRVLNQRANSQQLNDPDQYSNYQANKKKQLVRHYVEAAQPKIDRLKEQVKKAKEKGLPPEQLAEGEEKIKKLEEMVEQLKLQYPEVLSKQTLSSGAQASN